MAKRQLGDIWIDRMVEFQVPTAPHRHWLEPLALDPVNFPSTSAICRFAGRAPWQADGILLSGDLLLVIRANDLIHDPVGQVAHRGFAGAEARDSGEW